MPRVREVVSEPLTLDYFQERMARGWKLAAVEWQTSAALRSVDFRSQEQVFEQVPYGLRIADDCNHLIEDPTEVEALISIYEKVVEGKRPAQIAAELNQAGFRTRGNGLWTPGAVFDLLPRLIEAGPKLLRRPDWPERRSKLEVIA